MCVPILCGTGINDKYQLGAPNKSISEKLYGFTQEETGKTWQQVAVGGTHTLAIDSDGYLYGCGASQDGALSGGSWDVGLMNFEKISEKTWQKVDAGATHTMAIDSDGYLYGCGRNSYFELGLGDNEIKRTLTQVNDKKWCEISCQMDHSAAIDTDGYLWVTGRSTEGALGLGDSTGVATFTKVGEKTWQKVEAYGSRTMAIDTDGFLWAAGRVYDQYYSVFTLQHPTKKWQQVCGYASLYLAIDTDGYLYEFTGDGEFVRLSSKKWKQVIGSGSWLLAIDTDGYLWGQGTAYNGEMGFAYGIEEVPTLTRVNSKTWRYIATNGISTMGVAGISV